MNILAAFTLGVSILTASYIVFAASWYDIRAIMRRARLAKLRHSRQPSVAVLIDAHAPTDIVWQCLRAIRRHRYRHLTIVVAASQPSAEIKQLVQTYQQQYPSLPLRYYLPRHTTSQTIRFRRAYHTIPKHDYVLTIEASDILSPTIIKQAVSHFSDDQQLGALQIARRRQLTPTFLSLLQRYSEISHQLLKKAALLPAHRTLAHIQTGMMYQHHYFTTQARRHSYRRRYAASLTITTQQARCTIPPSRLAVVWWPLSTIAVCYFITAAVAAATLQSNAPLLLAWISICLWTLVAIWSETASRPLEKIRLSYGLLLAPLLFFIQSIWLSLVLPIATFYRFVRQWYRTRHHTYRYCYERYVLNNILAFKAWYEWMYPREVWYQDEWRTDD